MLRRIERLKPIAARSNQMARNHLAKACTDCRVAASSSLRAPTATARYPYVHDGMNFWVYGSGYMHANDGLFALFPRRTEGQEPGVALMAATLRFESGWQPIFAAGHSPHAGGRRRSRRALRRLQSPRRVPLM
jgi:hypothetical protein